MGRGLEKRERLPAKAPTRTRRAAPTVLSAPGDPVVMEFRVEERSVEAAVLSTTALGSRPHVLILPGAGVDPDIAGGAHGVSSVRGAMGTGPGASLIAQVEALWSDPVRRATWVAETGIASHRIRHRRSGVVLVDAMDRPYFAAFILTYAREGSREAAVLKAVNPLSNLRRTLCANRLLVIAHGPDGDRRNLVMEHFAPRCGSCAVSGMPCGTSAFAFALLGGVRSTLSGELRLDRLLVEERSHMTPAGAAVTHPVRGSDDARMITEVGAATGEFRVTVQGLEITSFTLASGHAAPCPHCGARPCAHDALLAKCA